MKNKLSLFIILIVGLFVLVGCSNKYDQYKSLDLKETLASEKIELPGKYNPKSDAITIYLFRGQGCGFCHAYLEFMASIAEDYGKYFNLKSYEVWNDPDNSALMEEVSSYLNEPAGGVPYIIIGEQVFTGYTSDYDEAIKAAIKDLYKTKEKNRYDVFKEMKRHPKKSEFAKPIDVIILSLIISLIVGGFSMIYTNKKVTELKAEIDKLSIKKESAPVKKSTPKKQTKNKK